METLMFEGVSPTLNPILAPNIMSCIEEAKSNFRYICSCMGATLMEKDIFYFISGEFIFVVANPILFFETILDEDGCDCKQIPRRNVTIHYFDTQKGLSSDVMDGEENVIASNFVSHKLSILCPNLISKITLDGQLLSDYG